jgi:YHS domain-containing protein
MHEYKERARRYTALADHLMQDVIRPRLERLARRFDNARLLGPDEAGRHGCVCTFAHTPRYPATAKLELGVSRDGDFEHIYLLHNLSILPVFFQFAGQDRLAVPLDRIEERQVADWVEQKILDFLDTYIRLETIEEYQADNYVIDPVCRMRINRLFAAATLEHGGQTYYFCIPECKEKFAAEPDKYLGVADAV